VEWAESSPPDIGGQTSSAAYAHSKGREPDPRRATAGNGSLMCCAPTVLAHVYTPPAYADTQVLDHTNVTHPNTVVRRTVKRFSWTLRRIILEGSVTRRSWNDAPLGMAPDGSSMGYAPMTQHLAETALRRCVYEGLSPHEALVELIELGGDTDTNAAVAGALIGAYYGPACWPENLLATLGNYQDWLWRGADLHRLARRLGEI
jgi:ADP-ribosyl-[dinitrogen reductase] hydrolase